MKKLIIFTDLDGTLLDHATYSFDPATPALQMIKQNNIPLIICSSKTKSEIEYYRKKIKNRHPFISENGGGIFIPKACFDFDIQEFFYSLKNKFPHLVFDRAGKGRFYEEKNYYVISLGASYAVLRKAMKALRAEGFKIKGFGDMKTKEVSSITGLSISEAGMAKARYFDEPFIFQDDVKKIKKLLEAIKAKGFKYTQGRLYHILGDNDKGKAIAILMKLYKKQFGHITTAALGDSPNDIPMLKHVDYPIVIKRPDGKYDPRIRIKKCINAQGIGPAGWNQAVLNLFKSINA